MITLQERKRLQELAGIEPESLEDAKKRIKAQAAAKKYDLGGDASLIPKHKAPQKQDVKSILHDIKMTSTIHVLYNKHSKLLMILLNNIISKEKN